ncbi:MAG: alpha/beta hydrolase, partial [Chitinivibrionales bacterium]|nr:alpha/beta hydrolase [Chitinivibrionales bacterium]
LGICLILTAAFMLLASFVQSDFGRLDVANVWFTNSSGRRIRAKLFRPPGATAREPAPGVVFVHGYQSTRESNDAYCIEMARRGIAVLSIDALGRGNSELPGDLDDPGFDRSFGARAAYHELRGMPFVRSERIGLMGHSLGGEVVYRLARDEPDVRALVVIGFAYDSTVSYDLPPNMLMIFGRWDEFRGRMTGTTSFMDEWMATSRTRRAIEHPEPQFGVTYGDFTTGTARRVVAPHTIHVLENHHHGSVAEALRWIQRALEPDPQAWLDPEHQVWHVKDWATLGALIAGLATILPLALLLLATSWFAPLIRSPRGRYACSPRTFAGAAALNAVLMWLYLPISLILFAVHAYVVPLDHVLPMMVVNCVAVWFVVINLVGTACMWRWYCRRQGELGISLDELGVGVDGPTFGKSVALGAVLFLGVYAVEHVLENLLLVDMRFVFSFANDLTPFRWLMVALYAPMLFVGFVGTGYLLYGQLRLRVDTSFARTLLRWSLVHIATLVLPLLMLLAVQYVPLLLADRVVLAGPGDMLALLTINVFHIVGVLILLLPLSAALYLLTGRPYVGATVSALIVAWMFASSQVIAPVPIATG